MRISDWSSDVCSSDLVGNPYQVLGQWYYPKDDRDYDQTGIASWYGPKFHGLSTANGETYDMDRVSAAHKTLPLPSYVEVTNLENGRRIIARVNDRGPFVGDRVIDLSRRSAELLDVVRKGTAKVRVRRVYPAEDVRNTEHTSELQSLMRISYAVFCLKKKKITQHTHTHNQSDSKKK